MIIKAGDGDPDSPSFPPLGRTATDYFEEIGTEFSKIPGSIHSGTARTFPVLQLLVALPIVAVAWIGILASVMWVTGQAPAALVILPPADLLDHLPAGTAVVSIGPYSVTLRGGADLVGALYRAGALLVLPAGLTGCLPQDPLESQRVG